MPLEITGESFTGANIRGTIKFPDQQFVAQIDRECLTRDSLPQLVSGTMRAELYELLEALKALRMNVAHIPDANEIMAEAAYIPDFSHALPWHQDIIELHRVADWPDESEPDTVATLAYWPHQEPRAQYGHPISTKVKDNRSSELIHMPYNFGDINGWLSNRTTHATSGMQAGEVFQEPIHRQKYYRHSSGTIHQHALDTSE